MSPFRTPRLPLLGRVDEIAVITSALELAKLGTGGAILVSGDPGIGKTRLAEAASDLAHSMGMGTLWGRCAEDTAAPAYWPWVQVLRLGAEGEPKRAFAGLSSIHRSALAPILPEVFGAGNAAAEPPKAIPEQGRFQLFEAAAVLLTGMITERPSLIVLDDIQWADEASLLLLQFLGPVFAQMPAVLLATYRGIDSTTGSALARTIAELSRMSTNRLLTLLGLDESATRDLVLSLGGAPAAVARIHAAAEGNPFYVTELVHLLHHEQPVNRGHPAGMSVSIPPTVREVIGQRLNRLTGPCRDALTIASVIGRGFTAGGLSRVLDTIDPVGPMAEDAVLDLLDEAVAAHLVNVVAGNPGRYLFAHALIRETLYDTLGSGERARLHRRVGEAIEDACRSNPAPFLSELSYHFVAGAPAGTREAGIDYAIRAGDQAEKVLAYEEAARVYDVALRLLETAHPRDDERLASVMLTHGEALTRAGALDAGKEALLRAADIAVELGARKGNAEAGRILVRAALAFGGMWNISGGVDARHLTLLRTAIAALGESKSIDHAMLVAVLALRLGYGTNVTEARLLAHEAVERAERVDSPATLAMALMARLIGDWVTEPSPVAGRRAQQRVESSDRILSDTLAVARFGEAAGHPALALHGYHYQFSEYLERGEILAADRALVAYAGIAERLRQPQFLWGAGSLQTVRAVLAGAFADGERLAQQTLAAGQRLQSTDVLPAFGVQLFSIRLHQGRLAEMEAAFHGVIQQYPQTPAYRAALAWLLLEADREDEARIEFERLAADGFVALEAADFWLPGLAIAGEVCARLGDVVRGRTLYTWLLPYAQRGIVVGFPHAYLGAAGRTLGLLAGTIGEPEAAQAHFETALEHNGRVGARAWLVQTQLDYGRFLARRGNPRDRGRARDLFQRANGEAATLGMPRAAEAIGAQLRADAARGDESLDAAPSVAHSSQSGVSLPDGLSAREADVLRHLVAGATSTEIAAELVVSPHTVRNHIASIYAKIGARRRGDAVAYAVRHGIV